MVHFFCDDYGGGVGGGLQRLPRRSQHESHTPQNYTPIRRGYSAVGRAASNYRLSAQRVTERISRGAGESADGELSMCHVRGGLSLC